MKVLYIHNDYARPSGEEHASGEIVELLREHGHEVKWFKRSSAEIADSKFGHVKSFFTGIHNPSSAKALKKVLKEYQPDIVQVQNLYPLISTSIFKPLDEFGAPIVMRCPNYRLFCPSGLCLDNNGQVCEKCWGKGKELWCIKNNCLSSKAKSIGYAARNTFARITGRITKSVDVFIVQSEFQKNKFISQGIPAENIGILPGIVPAIENVTDKEIGEFVTFVGRVSAEKGIYEFIDAARSLPHIPFKVAGNLDSSFEIPKDTPKNVEFVGFCKGDALNELYLKSRIIVVPSKWYEGFPNVIVRAMLLKRPVITTNIGAMQSIIDHNENGMLVPPADAASIKNAVSELWNKRERCIAMGENGKKKADLLYSREQIYKELIDIYTQAAKNRSNKKV